jgi:Xaa-Pro aminopeptidase
MKNPNFIFCLLILVTITFSKSNSQEQNQLPDISDLEITPANLNIYLERQSYLIGQIGDGIVVLNSNPTGYDGGRHESKVSVNFFYLTGLPESDCASMLTKNGPIRYSVFYPERDIRYKTYSGESIKNEEMKEKYQISEVLDYTALHKVLEEKITLKIPVYIDSDDVELKNKLEKLLAKTGNDNSLLKDITPMLNEMRVIKDELEIKRLQKAVDITGEAFVNVCKLCKPNMYEFEMEAVIEYNFRKLGAAMPGFASIVGSGKNSTILHYEKNDRKMKPGELLLMDVGAEYGYYTADISRTIPVNGTFSDEQKEIYELVLYAQKAAISEMKPGNFINSGHFKANEIIVDGLKKLGLITDPEKEWQRKFYILYPASHYLGMNVHDVGDYGGRPMEFMMNRANTTVKGRALKKGMVLTIEPGLYFRENGLDQLHEFFGNEATKEEIDEFITKVKPVYDKYKNIGIRIEDDILITETGNRNLSQNIPKEIADI